MNQIYAMQSRHMATVFIRHADAAKLDGDNAAEIHWLRRSVEELQAADKRGAA